MVQRCLATDCSNIFGNIGRYTRSLLKKRVLDTEYLENTVKRIERESHSLRLREQHIKEEENKELDQALSTIQKYRVNLDTKVGLAKSYVGSIASGRGRGRDGAHRAT